MSLLGFVLSLCGCKQSAKAPEVKPVPGVNQHLQYPVLLFGNSRQSIVIRDSAEKLTTTSNMEGSISFYEGSQLVDSAANLYTVESVRIASKVQKWPMDATGNSPHRVELRLRSEGAATLDDIKKRLTEVVKHPESLWSQLTSGNATAVKQINAAPTLKELIAECRDPYSWLK